MGSKPKKPPPSQAEMASAEVAAKKAEHFDKNYNPLNLAELRDAQSDDITNIARGRSSADLMQQMTAQPSYAMTQRGGEVASDMIQARLGQLGKATSSAEAMRNKRLAGGIGVAQGQSADNSKAMSLLGNLGTSKALQDFRNKQLVDSAKWGAAAKISGVAGDKVLGSGDPNQPNWWDKMREGLKEVNS